MTISVPEEVANDFPQFQLYYIETNYFTTYSNEIYNIAPDVTFLTGSRVCHVQRYFSFEFKLCSIFYTCSIHNVTSYFPYFTKKKYNILDILYCSLLF